MSLQEHLVQKLVKKAGKNYQAVIKRIENNPDYFWQEGGEDGTEEHQIFLAAWSHLMPEVAELAFLITSPVSEEKHEILQESCADRFR